MLTFFCVPKPFDDRHIAIIQKNAILSWKKLRPVCEIILIGDERGVADIAREYGVVYVPEIKKNENGTPLVNDAFRIARERSRFPILAYADCDVILMSDFAKAVSLVREPMFLMASRRWRLAVNEIINFNDPEWETQLHARVTQEGALHGPSALDYFVFPRSLDFKMPPFIMGRSGWDNWLVYQTISANIPFIDATPMVTAIHQNHPPAAIAIRKEECLYNNNLSNYSRMMTLRDADFLLTPTGLKKPPLARRIYTKLSRLRFFQLLLFVKRKIQNL